MFFMTLIVAFTIGSTDSRSAATEEVSKAGMVYICNGPQSKRYHSSSRCKGLNRCSSTISTMTRARAMGLGFTPCKICY